MRSAEKLARRFREVLLNGTWVANTNYKDQLHNLDWKTAVSKIDSLNSIAVLAQHIHYYIKGFKHVLEGEGLEIRDKFSFDFPPVESAAQWELILNRFWKDAERLAELIEQLPDDKLDQDFADEKYGSYLRNINGLIEHSYYHLGQIVLLKKQI